MDSMLPFDSNMHPITHLEGRHIELVLRDSRRFTSKLIDVGLNMVTKNWAKFIKIRLQSSHKDGMALLKGERAFIMEMEDGKKVIGKLEKGFELITKTRNIHLHLKRHTLHDHYVDTILLDKVN